VIEDCPDDAELVLQELRNGGYEIHSLRVEAPAAMNDALDRESWDLIIADYSMPHFSAPAALALLKTREVDVPFIIVSGTVGEEIVVSAMRSGAQDYLMKDNLKRLVVAVERELREAEQRRERRKTEEALRRSEEQLRQAQKVEAIGRLAGGISHDFNNLLTAINGYSELLLGRLPAEDPIRKDIMEIRKAGERATSLTRQLLAFSRKQILDTRVLSVNAIVADFERMLKRLIGEDIDLSTNLRPDLGRIKADPGQLEQVLMNLVVNARDAMPGGGKLTMETSNVDLDDSYSAAHVGVRPGRYVMLAVSDTGCGMDKEVQSHLFEPFFTTKEPGRGTGLGLSTVYGIVKQSGGNVWVYSEPGAGTTFKVYLPRVEAAQDGASREKPVSMAPGGSETILLAEDEQVVRELTRRILESNGYAVLEAHHGPQALEICERHRGVIHLMVTDVVMPKMSGRELAQKLAVLRPEMKVLYLSGYTDTAIVRHGVLEAGTAFLQKPFTPNSLARKVREVLDEEKAPGTAEPLPAGAGHSLRS